MIGMINQKESIEEKKQAPDSRTYEEKLRDILEDSPNARSLDRCKSFLVPWVPIPG